MAYQLMVTNNLHPTTRTAFPIFRNKEEYANNRVRMIRGIPNATAKKIQGLQPFQRGDQFAQDPLWRVHELNNTDKHRLIPVSVISGGWLVVLFPNAQLAQPVVPITGRLVPGLELLRFNLEGPYQGAEIDPFLACTVAFAEVTGGQDIAILPFLDEAAKHVGAIVESFATDFA